MLRFLIVHDNPLLNGDFPSKTVFDGKSPKRGFSWTIFFVAQQKGPCHIKQSGMSWAYTQPGRTTEKFAKTWHLDSEPYITSLDLCVARYFLG